MSKRKRTALLLVAEKTGIVEFADQLTQLGFSLISAGSTAKTLRQAEIPVEEAALAPLDPGLLARIEADPADPDARRRLREFDAEAIDLVAVTLYPVAEVLANEAITQPEVMEFLDVTPSMLLRAAARGFEHTAAVCDPRDYAKLIDALREFDELPREQKQGLAAKAFFTTAYYDSTVAQYLAEKPDLLADEMVIGLKKVRDLRYGENPHQRGALYTASGARPWGLAAASQVHGKDLTLEHYLGLETAVELIGEFSEPACAIVRHAQPCGAATAGRPVDALQAAYRADAASAAGGVAALNREADVETAALLAELQLEAVVAPDFSQAALEKLRLLKDLRLLSVPSALLSPHEMTIHPVSGGLLIEDKNSRTLGELLGATQRKANPAQEAALTFAWKVAKHATSAAIVLAKGTRTVGIGAGQPSRLDALKTAIAKSNERHPILAPQDPLVLASDGSLPLRCLHEAAAIGVAAVIQPGGTSEDAEAVRLCDQEGVAMVFAGLRHHKH